MNKVVDDHFARFSRGSLFSQEFLKNHLEEIEGFKDLDDAFLQAKFEEVSGNYSDGLKRMNEAQLENNFFQPIFSTLGHIYEVQTAKKSEDSSEGTKKIDYAFFSDEDDKKTFLQSDNSKNSVKYASAATICETKIWGKLDNYDKITRSDNQCPIWQLKKSYLDNINPKEAKATVPYGILTDGKSWRIYSYRADADKFFEIDLEAVIVNEDFFAFKVFWFFFSNDAFGGDTYYLNTIETGSKKLQAEVSDELRKQVYLSLELIATGLFRVYQQEMRDWSDFEKYPEVKAYLDENLLDEVDIADPKLEKIILDVIYSESLVYLFRILFLLYADHRNLFKHKKVESIFYNLLNKIDAYTSEIGSVTEDLEQIAHKNDDYDINTVFDEIDDEFNGGLFNRKQHWILNRFDIDNVLYANAIDYLTRTYDKKKKKPLRVDFSVLEVRHLGTIYEGILEYKLNKVEEDKEIPLLSDKKKKRLVKKGDLFLVNDKGERKSSGSYYTPDYIVEYIVRNTVGPLIDEIEAKDISIPEKISEILALRICDPAMGSGHFLVEVISFMDNRINDMIQLAIDPLLNKPGRKSKQLKEYEELLVQCEEGRFKRIIGKRCIYGVDKNAMAVELAKLSIWIFTLQRGKKLEFFDYNLRCGDSLIGSQEKTFSARIAKKDDKNRMLFASDAELFQYVIDDFKSEFEKYFEQENVEDRMKFYESTIRPQQQKLKFLANIELAIDFAEKGDDLKEIYEGRKKELLEAIRKDTKNEYLKRLLKNKGVSDWEKKLFERAKIIRDEYLPIHWELDFPNVFIDKGGFDAVVGNPPYVNFANMNIIYRSYYKKKYYVCKNKTDLYAFFIEKVFNIIKINSFFSFIVPHTWLATSSFEPLRKMIIDNSKVEKLIDLPFGVFKDAVVKTLIFLINKQYSKNYEIKVYNEEFEVNVNIPISEIIKEETNPIILNWSKEKNSLFNKMNIESTLLGDIIKFTRGIKTSNDNRFIHKEKKNDNYKKLIRGGNIKAYRIDFENEYIWYMPELMKEKVGSLPHSSVLFEQTEKLITQRVNSSNQLLVAYDASQFYCLDTTNVSTTNERNKEYHLKYLLTILNSNLINIWYSDKYKMPTISGYELHSIPVKEIYKNSQTPFINRADIMLSQNKLLQQLNEDFWELFRADFTLEKTSQKLEKWYLLDWKDFVAELKKKKVKMADDLEVKWLKRFREFKEEALKIKETIDTTDAEIDLMVYKLYELTHEEVKIVDPEFSMSKKAYNAYQIPAE